MSVCFPAIGQSKTNVFFHPRLFFLFLVLMRFSSVVISPFHDLILFKPSLLIFAGDLFAKNIVIIIFFFHQRKWFRNCCNDEIFSFPLFHRSLFFWDLFFSRDLKNKLYSNLSKYSYKIKKNPRSTGYEETDRRKELEEFFRWMLLKGITKRWENCW